MSSRLPSLDIARGIMVTAMIFYHALYLLSDVFGVFSLKLTGSWINILTAFWGGIFILIAGISAALNWNKYQKNYIKSILCHSEWNEESLINQSSARDSSLRSEWQTKDTFTRRYLKRGAILAIFAGAITSATSFFEPNQIILFGILHLFAISFLLLPIFAKLKTTNLLLSLAIIAVGIFFYNYTFSIENLWIFGVRTVSFYSADYYPIFPYFWVLLFGFSLGKWLLKKAWMEKIFGRNIPGSLPIRWLWKHSLIIYISHVPLLYGIFWLIFR